MKENLWKLSKTSARSDAWNFLPSKHAQMWLSFDHVHMLKLMEVLVLKVRKGTSLNSDKEKINIFKLFDNFKSLKYTNTDPQ